ncbi:MAG: glycoside hydrolase family 36 N-terminal domain-containing protein, partial [Armatimonadota bacterium]
MQCVPIIVLTVCVALAAANLAYGDRSWLDRVFRTHAAAGTCPAFSFLYDGKPSSQLLTAWKSETQTQKLDQDCTRIVTTWRDTSTGLQVIWDILLYADFPAADWVLYFENTGASDTPIVEDIQAADIALNSPPYTLHRTNGAPANPTDFEPSELIVDAAHPQAMGGGGGRSSNKDLPFFKIKTSTGSVIIAVGWSGQWLAKLECPDDKQLRVKAGMERTRLKLHPGERIRTPRILLLEWHGDTLESNAQFRQLIYKHYHARRGGAVLLPILFVNTCFTRGGGWLNECNAENQISLIKAYAP